VFVRGNQLADHLRDQHLDFHNRSLTVTAQLQM